MKILFCTNLPSPYRIEFFNELGKYCDLTVCYERRTSTVRDAKWKGSEVASYKEVYLDLKQLGEDKSFGTALIRYIKSAQFDHIILTNHSSPAVMGAILYCRLKHIPYMMEHDGGFNKADSLPKRIVKKMLLCGAKAHLTTCDQHIEYLCSLGIKRENIYKYPFSSIHEAEVEQNSTIPSYAKTTYRKMLGITEEKMILSVGRFSYESGYGKGYDVLLKVASILPKSVAVCIVGDEPTEEFVKLKQDMGLTNVHYIGFKTKAQLAKYYAAADIMILLSRGDIWGLVVNEAMSYGIPVITSEFCVAGVEMIEDGKNGYIVSLTDPALIAIKISSILEEEETAHRFAVLGVERAKKYTIETMVQRHIEILRSYYHEEYFCNKRI